MVAPEKLSGSEPAGFAGGLERGQIAVCHDARNAKRKEEAKRSVQNFIEDEGRPLGVGVQAQTSNHLKRRG